MAAAAMTISRPAPTPRGFSAAVRAMHRSPGDDRATLRLSRRGRTLGERKLTLGSSDRKFRIRLTRAGRRLLRRGGSATLSVRDEHGGVGRAKLNVKKR